MADSKQNNSEQMASCNSRTCHGKWMSEEYKPSLVSFIIPTYKRAKFLAKAMDSVPAQTYHMGKLILAGNGSNWESPS